MTARTDGVNLYLVIKTGDTAKLKEIFRILHLDGVNDCSYEPNTAYVLTRLLGTASAIASCRVLNEGFVKELIARIAPCCDILDVLRFMRTESGIKNVDYTFIPKYIRDAVRTRNLGITVCGRSIESLSWVSFRAFVCYILEGDPALTDLRSELNAPILRQAYKYNLVSDSALLASMGLSIPKPENMESIEEILGL